MATKPIKNKWESLEHICNQQIGQINEFLLLGPKILLFPN
jgi:hypothetical protein